MVPDFVHSQGRLGPGITIMLYVIAFCGISSPPWSCDCEVIKLNVVLLYELNPVLDLEAFPQTSQE